jgi:hypothetical protein
MSERLNIYPGTDNAIIFSGLKYKDPLIDVPPNTLTRAMFAFGSFCVDTETDTATFYFQENATKIKLIGGQIDGLPSTQTDYVGCLTLYDLDGKYAWKSFKVRVYEWLKCNGG